MGTTNPTAAPGRWLPWLGLGLPLLAVATYAAQLSAQRLSAPWYLPIAATLGVVCLAVALWQAHTAWRLLALLLGVVLCGTAWLFLLIGRLPEYAGPLAVGTPFPAFATTDAAGSPFSQRDLHGDRDTVFVFFRGRW